ncbi:YlbF family regulator [Natronococcus pandeyae]|uniref:YlbF family regulator n=1 Tax=Natronococcus pandeyae TaxID=2055836 RepID=A0A8J8TPR2_9EURY|nr:halo-CC-star protein HcsL [Natronococcus pandeyae]TYL36115.1 YlbF family regulator [Natronococcus pandeyae]
MSNAHSQDADVTTELRAFVDTLSESATYQQFIEAGERLGNDSEATALLREYRQKQQQLQGDGFDQSLMSELQELQTELSNNETIQQHRAAQNDLVELLQETNDVISDRIGREFAQSTGGGCC